jgi:GTPase SAR1 family protein
MTDFSSFANYKQTVMNITMDLKKMRDFSLRMGLEGNVAAIDDVQKRLSEDIFQVAIIGEFKRGKSTLINALLGKDVLPTDVLPCSAALNKITYSITPFAKIEYRDGKTEDITIDQLIDYVTKLTKESEERARSIKEATVFYPVNFCKNGVTIIDTPGLNDDAAMADITLSVLPKIDAAIMVIMAMAPFSESERDFLENKILASDLGRVLFVVTGIDLLDEDDSERVIKNITERIQEHVINKAKSTYGENSKEFEAYKRKIGNVKVYGLSAKKALKAKEKGDNDMLAKSLFPQFEAALERFLTEDRGAIMLSVPVNRLNTSAMELVKAIQLREVALSMNSEEFNKKYKHAMDEIESIRCERQSEFTKINEASLRTYVELIPLIQNYWPALEGVAVRAVDNFNLTNNDIKGSAAAKKTQERLLDAVKKALAWESQTLSERVQEYISIALENEAERISGFEEHFFDTTNRIQSLFVSVDVKGKGAIGTGDTVISAITNVFFGIGGVYMGFKQSGWKGALLGGVTGVGVFAFALGAVMSFLPMLWPAMLIAGIVSTFTTKFSLKRILSGDKTESYKEMFKDNIIKELANMKEQNDFSDTVKHQIETAFEALKKKIETETEHILGDTQKQLTNLKVELTNASVLGENEKREMTQMIAAIDEICVRSNELNKQLVSVLS